MFINGNKLNVNGIEITLTKDQMAKLFPNKMCRAIPDENGDERFFVIDYNGEVEEVVINSKTAKTQYEIANYFIDADMASKRAHTETLLRLIWRYAEVNNTGEAKTERRYIITRDVNKNICISVSYMPNPFIPKFESKSVAKKCLDTVVMPYLKIFPDAM